MHDPCCNEDGSAWHLIARYRGMEKSLPQFEDVRYIRRQERKSQRGRKGEKKKVSGAID